VATVDPEKMFFITNQRFFCLIEKPAEGVNVPLAGLMSGEKKKHNYKGT
jgi:hypothetical protein